MNNFKTWQSNIFRFIKERYLILIGISLSLLFTFLIAFFIAAPSPDKEAASALPAAPTALPTRGIPTVIPESNYQEQTAKEEGTVDFSESSHFATEAKKDILPDRSIKYTMDSENPNRSDIVIVKNGAIIFARHAVVGAEISDGYKNLLGKQDHTLSGPTFYGPDTLIYYYSDGGTALTVNPKTNTVYEEFTFQPPISLEEFNLKYRQYVQ